jgi:ABC-type Fe3+-hydroxamate transport system substrate-binding protein
VYILKSTFEFNNNLILKISDSNLVERPGPRIADGLDELAKLIHPELFGQVSK